jgi:hypothetical protein
VLCGAPATGAVFWCRSTTASQIVATIKETPMPLYHYLKKGTSNFICYGLYVKTVNYTNKKIKIKVFWTAIVFHNHKNIL